MVCSPFMAIMIVLSSILAVVLAVLFMDVVLGVDNNPSKITHEVAKLEDLIVSVQLEKFTNPNRVPNNNVSSVAALTYPKFISCLQNSPHAHDFNFGKVHYPIDAEEHYKDLLNKTKIFRSIYMHSHAYYKGPWIENYFIHNFIDQPLSYFSGIFPLFIQWTDIHVHDFSENKTEGRYFGPYIPEWQQMAEILTPMLRDDVVYLAVIQDDEGMRKKIATLRPNILSISAGGFGHIAIPLIKGELAWVPPPPKFLYDVGFYGSHQRQARAAILSQLKMHAGAHHLSLKLGESEHWLQDMLNTKFNLAPRGFGRTSFRLSEIVQMGRLPVYLFDDIPWIPYGDSNISIKSFGFVTRGREISGLCQSIKELTDEDYKHRLELVKAVREEYTYGGVIRQIDKFFADPFGLNGGNLVCTRVPQTEKRRQLQVVVSTTTVSLE